MRPLVQVLGMVLAAFGLSTVVLGVVTLVRRAVPERFQNHLQSKKKQTFEWKAFGWSRIALGAGLMIVCTTAYVDSRFVWRVLVVIAAVVGLTGQALDKRSRVPYVPEVVDDATRDRWHLPPE